MTNAKVNNCLECGNPCSRYCDRCYKCSSKARRLNNRNIDKDGYVVLTSQWEHPNVRKNGKLFEHVLVMSEILGRGLREYENVHHKNGVRDDNRPENLELWTSVQPAGQRVSDMLEFCQWYLEEYEERSGDVL